MSVVPESSGLEGTEKSDVVGNRGNGERGEGRGVGYIQAAPGGSGVTEAHAAVGYSAERRPPTRGVIVSEAGDDASTCLTQDLKFYLFYIRVAGNPEYVR